MFGRGRKRGEKGTKRSRSWVTEPRGRSVDGVVGDNIKVKAERDLDSKFDWTKKKETPIAGKTKRLAKST